MKSFLNVCLYSGMCHLDPKCDLSDEDTKILRDKIFALKEKPKREPFPRLGKTISVRFESEKSKVVAILSYPEYTDLGMPAAVLVYWNSNELAEPFVDTENINDFLHELAKPAILQHQEDMKKEWEKNYEDLLGIPEKEKI